MMSQYASNIAQKEEVDGGMEGARPQINGYWG